MILIQEPLEIWHSWSPVPFSISLVHHISVWQFNTLGQVGTKKSFKLSFIGKFSLKNTVINVVAGLGLISFITMFCDFILLNYVSERKVVSGYKLTQFCQAPPSPIRPKTKSDWGWHSKCCRPPPPPPPTFKHEGGIPQQNSKNILEWSPLPIKIQMDSKRKDMG